MRSICPAVTREQSPAPPHNSTWDWTSLGHHKRLPEFPDVTRESRPNLRKTTRFHCHRELRPFSTAASWEKSHVPSWNSKGYLTHLMQLKKSSLTYPSYSRGTSSFLAQLNLSPFSPPNQDMRVESPACLERDPDLPVAPQEEAGLTLKLERTPRGSCLIPQDTDFPVNSR